ncbi:rCG50300 [Rattus norvegicus]|uniref:RCG50300 n=1 Tax=Rattus norvegicus TaxID=10116 RepID=A6JYZ5_RAT|nr:rCG50300 [Rattus norvegicus]
MDLGCLSHLGVSCSPHITPCPARCTERACTSPSPGPPRLLLTWLFQAPGATEAAPSRVGSRPVSQPNFPP